jgi:hypothetical protein
MTLLTWMDCGTSMDTEVLKSFSKAHVKNKTGFALPRLTICIKDLVEGRKQMQSNNRKVHIDF